MTSLFLKIKGLLHFSLVVILFSLGIASCKIAKSVHTINCDNTVVFVRKEIRDLSKEELDRFLKAIDRMMVNDSGAGSSPYYQLASIYGRPEPIYAVFGRESFPAWHRIYLHHFEKELRYADRKLGGDGNVAIPYWDFTKQINLGAPSAVVEHFQTFPSNFFPPDFMGSLNGQAMQRNAQKQISSQLRS